MPSERFTLDQEVILNHDGRTRKATITRVGRVNVGVMYFGREISFDKTTGVEKRGADTAGPAMFIRTEDEHAAELRRGETIRQLRTLGITYGHSNYRFSNFSDAALQQILEVARADQS